MAKRSPPPMQRRGKPSVSNAQLQALAADFRAAMARGDYAGGRVLAERALRAVPGNMTVLADYALCLMRTGAYEAAYRVYMQIHDAPPALRRQASPTWIDGLAEVCGWLEKRDELRRFGNRALSEADARFADGHAFAVPDRPPPAFDPAKPTQNVIAFTLFGADPRYCESGVMNVRLANELFAGWTCRFYLDDSVPMHVQERLRQDGAQIVHMHRETSAMSPLLWRFLVMDDPAVRRFLVRDADSLLSERDLAAVDEWLRSDRWFHMMRDYFTHTELILAGMWGGCAGVFPPVEPLIDAYTRSYAGSTRFVDQYFLRETLWPTVRTSLLSHDELFGFLDPRPFPPHPPVRWKDAEFHVGSNASYQRLAGPSALADGERQVVRLWLEDEGPFEYQAVVQQAQWSLGVPFFLADALATGRLRVDTTG